MKNRTMHIITANRLKDGLVVFRAGKNQWSLTIAAAELLADSAAVEAALESAMGDARANRVVEPYAVEVVVSAPGEDPVPVRFRERIRVGGPTTGYSRTKSHKLAA